MTDANIIKVTLPTNAITVAKMQAEIEGDAEFLLTTTVDNADDYTFADELLSDLAGKLDALVAMRKRATDPLKASAKEIESWFRPSVKALEGVITHLKGVMGTYRKGVEAARLASIEAAAVAAETHDAPALLEAMAATPAAPEGRATCAWYWRVARVFRPMLRDEDLIPDLAKFDAIAKAHPGADTQPPVIPGVTFERCPRIGARR